MASPKQRDTNKSNAQLSKGPNDTSSTRFNALKHGILSKECFIAVGDGQEDREAFEEFSSALQDTLSPIGAIEELMVDKLIALTWRSRRVLRYETAAIRSISDTAIDDWERKKANDPLRIISGRGLWQSAEDLASNAEWLKEDLQALAKKNPIAVRPEIWRSVFLVASMRLEVPIQELLGLDEPWEDTFEYSKDEVQSVVDSVCEDGKISEPEFWQQVKEDVRFKYEEAARKQDRRRLDLERVRLSVSLPRDDHLSKIQRYESHLSREFYKALHELQRLQAARLGLRPSVPLAVDIAVNLAPLEAKE